MKYFNKILGAGFNRANSIFISILFLFSFNICFSQIPDQPTFKLYLIGDAGESDSVGATLKQLKSKLEANPNSAVIFLGDNCYTGSILGKASFNVGGYDGTQLAKDRLMGQLNILRDYKGSAFFIPGNHDWFNKTNVKGGRKHLLEEENFIEDTLKNFSLLKNHGETFLPSNGSPGPVSMDFNDGKTRIIFIDTQRLIIEEVKRGNRKDTTLLNKFYDDLKQQLKDASAKKEKIIVVAHHPILAKGKHSVSLGFWQKIIRRFADTNVNYPAYNRVAVRLDSLLKAHHHPDVYYVAGHEHSLEYFLTDSLHYIISGAGCKVDNIAMESCTSDGECLQWNEEGFFEIDFYGWHETVLMYHRRSDESEMKVKCVAGCK